MCFVQPFDPVAPAEGAMRGKLSLQATVDVFFASSNDYFYFTVCNMYAKYY